jgi:predicted nucleotidyltransferase
MRDPKERLQDILEAKREEILRITQKHGVGRVRIFGSVARGEATEDSDIDLLIDVEGPTPPWFPGGLVADLEALLGRHVDVVEPDAIREGMRGRILEEAVPL